MRRIAPSSFVMSWASRPLLPPPSPSATNRGAGRRRTSSCPPLCPRPGCSCGEDLAARRRVDDTVRVRVRDDVRVVPLRSLKCRNMRPSRGSNAMPSRPCSEPSWNSRTSPLRSRIRVATPSAIRLTPAGLGGHVERPGRLPSMPSTSPCGCRRSPASTRPRPLRAPRRWAAAATSWSVGGAVVVVVDVVDVVSDVVDDADPDESSSPPHAPAARTSATHAAAIRFRCAFMPRSCVPRPARAVGAAQIWRAPCPDAALQSDVPNSGYPPLPQERSAPRPGCPWIRARIRDDGGSPQRPARRLSHS